MGWFDGFPFTSKEERDRRRREFEKRVVPFGVEEHREKLKALLKELFPGIDPMDTLFTYFDAKDAYTYKETKEEGEAAARRKMKRQRWVTGRVETIMIRLIELEGGIESLDDFPTAKEVLDGLYGE